MAKFDFNSSRYAKFFADKSNQNFLQTFINTEGILYTNYGWYKTQGHKAAAATPTSPAGVASFTIKARSLEAAPLMDLRAPLGDSHQMDKEGLKFYTASIPDFIAPGYVETAMEREARIAQFEMFGNDADIIAQWVQNLQSQIDSADATMNFLTASLMSTAKVDYSAIGRGIQAPLHKADVPAENFVKAGAKVWTDADCNILSQMAKIEAKFRDKWGYTGAMIWQMPKDMYQNVFLKNKEVRELITSYRKLNYIADTENMPVTQKMFNDAFVDYEGVSPIEVVVEKERNFTHVTDTMIHGWDQNVAVLRPAGDACEWQYTTNLDKQMFDKYGSNIISKVWAQANDGLSTIVNTTFNNGQYKEWHTDLMMSATPALIEFPNHVIVKTNEAGE